MAARRMDPTKQRKEDQKIAEDAASAYVADKGFSESSLEAVRRAAKANKRRPRVRIGAFMQDI